MQDAPAQELEEAPVLLVLGQDVKVLLDGGVGREGRGGVDLDGDRAAQEGCRQLGTARAVLGAAP